MRKNVLIALLTILSVLICIGTMTLANSGQSESKDILEQANKLRAAQRYDDAEKLYNQVKAENPGSAKALEAQKQLIHLAIDKNNLTQADTFFNQMVTEFAQTAGLDEAVYEAGKDIQYTRWNSAKANNFHKYNLEHFPDTKFGMMSNVEIIRSYLRDGNKIADAEVEKWLDTYKDQPDQAMGIYQIARAYVGNNKIEKGQQLYEYAIENHSSHVYGKLSKVRYNVTNKDYDAADQAADSLIAALPKAPSAEKNEDAREGIRELADLYRDKKEYARAAHFYKAEVTNWPETEDIVTPYREAVYCYINVKDINSADALIGQMQTGLAKDPQLARTNFDIGNYFLNNAKDTENALKVHAYNAEHYPNVMEAMWSQAAVVWYHVRHDDTEKADAEYEKLLANYKGQETLPKEIFQIGDIYRDEKKNYEKAVSLYQYQLENWPNYGEPTDTYRKLACTYIDMKDKENADLIIQQMQTNRAKDPHLARSNFDIANYYLNDANDAENALKIHKLNADNHSDIMEAMWSQAALVWYYVRHDDQANADAEYAKLLNTFKDQASLPKEIFQIGDIYREEKNYDKAIFLYKYQLENWPEYGEPIDIYRKMACTYVDMNDITNADSVIADIQTKFAKNSNLARTNFDIGNYFLNDANDPENALKIHAYNADNCTNQLESMWSQAAIVWYYVRAKDNSKADAAYAKLLEVFKDQKTLAKEVFQIADIYTEVGDTAKARTLHNQVLKDWPESEYAFDAREGLIKANMTDGKGSEVLNNIDEFITDYKGRSDLPMTVFQIGEKYWKNKKEADNVSKAQKVWEKLIAAVPDSDFTAEATFMVGEASLFLGEDDEALQTFQAFLDKWPNYNYSWVALDRIIKLYKKSGINSSKLSYKLEDQIIAGYEKLIEQYPNSPGVKVAKNKLDYYKKKKEYENTDIKSMSPSEKAKFMNKMFGEEGTK